MNDKMKKKGKIVGQEVARRVTYSKLASWDKADGLPFEPTCCYRDSYGVSFYKQNVHNNL